MGRVSRLYARIVSRPSLRKEIPCGVVLSLETDGPPTTHTIWDFIIIYFECGLKINEFVFIWPLIGWKMLLRSDQTAVR